MTYQERTTYTQDIHNMSAAQIWAAWKRGDVTMYHLIEYQRRHGVTFTGDGKRV